MIDVKLLGSAATMPTPERGLSAAVLRCAGRCILFDCGEGTQLALRRERVSPVKIDLIALSHYHGDHIFGLPGLLQSMSCMNRTEPLVITGPEGLEDAMLPILSLAGVQSFPIHLVPAPAQGFEMYRLNRAWPLRAQCAAIPTEHRVKAQGYIFSLARPARFMPEKASSMGVPVSEWKRFVDDPSASFTSSGRTVYGYELMGEPRSGLAVVFSGDTQPCDTIRKAASNADLLIHDATYGDDDDEQQALTYGHSTFRQAAELSASAKVKRLWLTHFSQMLRTPEDYLPNAAAFPAAVCGFDGMSITLRFED